MSDLIEIRNKLLGECPTCGDLYCMHPWDEMCEYSSFAAIVQLLLSMDDFEDYPSDDEAEVIKKCLDSLGDHPLHSNYLEEWLKVQRKVNATMAFESTRDQ